MFKHFVIDTIIIVIIISGWGSPLGVILDPKEDNKENDAEKDKHYDGITDSLWNL